MVELKDKTKGDVMVIKANRTDTGVELFVQSETIAKWVKTQAEAASTDTLTGKEYATNLGSERYYRRVAGINGLADPVSSPSYSDCLLLNTKLAEGFTIAMNGLITRDKVQNMIDNLREKSVRLYRNYIAPYAIEVRITSNTVD